MLVEENFSQFTIEVFIFFDKFQEVQLKKKVSTTNNKYFIGITATFFLSNVQHFRYHDNLALEESSPKTRNFGFYQKKASIKWADPGDPRPKFSSKSCIYVN